jgi:hypothetical protein
VGEELCDCLIAAQLLSANAPQQFPFSSVRLNGTGTHARFRYSVAEEDGIAVKKLAWAMLFSLALLPAASSAQVYIR